MIRQRDLVYFFPVDAQWSNPATNECPRLNRAAQRDNANVVPIVNLELGRELRRNFGKHLRLQFREVRQKPGHPSGSVMLGQAVGR